MPDLTEFRLSWAAWEMFTDADRAEFINEIKKQLPEDCRLVSEEPEKTTLSMGIVHWLSSTAIWKVEKICKNCRRSIPEHNLTACGGRQA